MLGIKRLLFGLALVLAGAGGLMAAEFSDQALALPFPPDAKEIEFAANFGDVKFSSASPLMSLAAFYLKEMGSRGWQHDDAAAVVEEEAIKLTFKHEAARVKLELRKWSSKEVKASLDCDNLQFAGTDDPVKMAAAGVPVARAVMQLQKDFPLPTGAVNLNFTGDGCTFKSPLKLQEAFDHFTKQAPGKGFRESRRPIVTDTRRYTEFKNGAALFSVNVFTDAVGSRIILSLKDPANEKPVPPLAAVASLPIKGGLPGTTAAGEAATSATATPIDVSTNKGTATVDYNGKKYTLANIASFQTKDRGADVTMVVFSAQPVALNKMQSLIATKKSFSFGDLYPGAAPDHLILQVSAHTSFFFALRSTSIGHPVEKGIGELKAAAGRVQGTLKMPPMVVFDTESISFTATVDAVIMTPTTRLGGPGESAAPADPVVRSDNPSLAGAPIAFPDGVENGSSEGTKFRKTYRALIAKPMAEVTAFFRKEMTAKGWKPAEADSAASAMELKTDKLELSVTIKPQRGKTAVEVFVRDTALAKQEGVFPEAGKGRLVLGNAGDTAVVFSIGSNNYPLAAGQGAKDYKQALNYSLAPGKYTVVLKVPGQAQQFEKIDVTAGTTWGVIALPGGGCLPVQLY